jgi:hypothetical protein
MAYIVNKTDGTILTTIVDGTIDNTTSLTLFGKSYSGFGELLNEDLVRLLENSASTSSPAAPLRGELWFDTTTNQLKVYDGSAFKPASGAKSQATAPTSPTAGDLWVDSDDKQLFFYTGSAWQLAGPVYTDGQQLSGFKIETVGSSGGDKVIASMYSGTIRVAVLSASQFIPSAGSPSSTPLLTNGFAQIYPGITLNSNISAEFSGTTTTATNLNISGTSNPSGTVIAGGNFMRKDAAQTTQGAITIDDNAGIIVGENQEGEINVSSNNLIIANTSEDKNISLKVNNGGSAVEAITIDGDNSRVGIFTTSPTVPLEITGNVKITGNLSVSGEYDTTTTTNVLMNDVFVKLNNGNGADVDSGIVVDRDSGREAKLYWNSTSDYWVAGKSESGSYSQIIRDEDAVTDGDANKGKVLKTDVSTGNVTVTDVTIGTAYLAVSTSSTSQKAATIRQVAESIKRWGGTAITPDAGTTGNTVAGNRYVETVPPDAGVNDAGTLDGDLWFVRQV